MLFTLKWMDNLQQSECHQTICHLFFIFNLTCCEFVALKENTVNHSFQNHYNKQTKHPPQGFPYGEPGCPAKGRNWGLSPWKPKSLNFPLWSPPPKNWVLNHRPHIGKKGISNSFRQILLKILPPACIFSHAVMTYLERLVGTKFLNTKQCPAGLSPRIIPHFLPKPSWEILRMGENPTLQPKIYSFPLTKKSPLINLHLKLSKVSSFLPH